MFGNLSAVGGNSLWQSVSADADGAAFVIGDTYGSYEGVAQLGSGRDVAFSIFEADGSRRCTDHIRSELDITSYSVIADEAGGAWINFDWRGTTTLTWGSTTLTNSNNNIDGLFAHYSSLCVRDKVAFTAQRTTSSHDQFYSIRRALEPNSFVGVGITSATLGPPYRGTYNYFSSTNDPVLDMASTHSYTWPSASGDARFYDVAVDSTGGMTVCGISQSNVDTNGGTNIGS